jgi:hypothetical protein
MASVGEHSTHQGTLAELTQFNCQHLAFFIPCVPLLDFCFHINYMHGPVWIFSAVEVAPVDNI